MEFWNSGTFLYCLFQNHIATSQSKTYILKTVTSQKNLSLENDILYETTLRIINFKALSIGILLVSFFFSLAIIEIFAKSLNHILLPFDPRINLYIEVSFFFLILGQAISCSREHFTILQNASTNTYMVSSFYASLHNIKYWLFCVDHHNWLFLVKGKKNVIFIEQCWTHVEHSRA